MSLELSEIANINIWAIVKWFYILAFALYVIFAAIILKQTSIMSKTLNGSMNLPLKTIGYVHLVVALLIFFLALIVL